MRSLVRNKNIKLIINYFLGPLVFIILSYSIYTQILQQPNWKESVIHLKEVITTSSILLLLLTFLLMFVNWGIEARKWQLALKVVQPINFITSFKAVFTGTTLASFTPNRTGEYFGRILYVDKGKKLKAIPLTILCSMAQLQITLYTGLFALWMMRNILWNPSDSNSNYIEVGFGLLFSMILGSAILLTFFYFRLGWLIRRIEASKSAAWLVKYIVIVEKCEATILWRILSLSLLRYLVFIAQYYLVFRVFNVQLTLWQCLESISVLFLLLAIIPSFTFLTDLGIRWKAGIEIVSLFSINSVGIFAAAFTIWLFNLIIPALIGSLLILSIRIFKSKDS